MRHIRFLAVIILVGLAGYHVWSDRPIKHGPGEIAPKGPMHFPVPNPVPFDFKGMEITQRLTFDAEARVLGIKHYWRGEQADISPADIVLAWGPLSDETVLEKFEVRQQTRAYHWTSEEDHVPLEVVIDHSVNVHIFPGNRDVEKRLKEIREGNLVSISGYVISAESDDGKKWSVPSRQDLRTMNGRGPSELIWVEDLKIL